MPRDKIQRILEVARLTTCPGNLQPWRAVVVARDELDDATRDGLIAADNWQGPHTQAPVWIYWYADPDSAKPEDFRDRTMELVDAGALPPAFGWSKDQILASIEEGTEGPQGMPGIHELVHGCTLVMSGTWTIMARCTS